MNAIRPNTRRLFAIFAALALGAAAGYAPRVYGQEDATPKAYPEGLPLKGNPCEDGVTAWTCTIQCDAGSRTPWERIFPNSPGVELCRVSDCTCEPLIGFRGPPQTPGLAVLQQGRGDLVGVTWGLDRLLGHVRGPNIHAPIRGGK